MNRFIQLHLLTSYPPANLNRDDLGRPKTAVMGGAQRLRVSSQSLKRAWRTSDIFESTLKGHVGTRTKEIGVHIFNQLLQKGVTEKKADDWAKSIAAVFGKLKKDSKDSHEIEQLAHFSPDELRLIDELVSDVASRGEGPTEDELRLLRRQHTAADIALFGRMLASSPAYNMEAAAQVAHAITVHKVTVEDDFFTAVDDLNKGEEDMGAGHMGETEFAAGLFYQYVCIDRDLLTQNLSDNTELAKKTISALIEAAATVAPTGKQNSFASRARASYILCEVGIQQPRSLSVAFLKPVQSQDILEESVTRISDYLTKMDNAYGKCADSRSVMNISTGEGSLQSIIATATE